MKRLLVAGICAIGLLGSAASAGAGPIVGTLTLGGGAVLLDSGGVPLGDETLDFTPLGGPGGAYLSIVTSNGYFTGMASTIPGGPFYGGTTLDLSNDPTPAFGVFAPAGVLISIPDFLDNFTAPGFEDVTGNNLEFELNFMPLSAAAPCTGAEAIGQACSVVGSQFTLTRETNGTSVSFSVIGLFTADPPGPAGPDEGLGVGTYSATITGLTPGEIIDRIALGQNVGIGPNHDEPFGWDATFVSFDNTIPEPATLLTFGVGSALLAARRRRKKA